jgi:hypothetical protein
MAELTNEQKQKVTQWAAEGLSLSDIQKRITSELEISMTYMDVRLLVLDLKVAIKDKPAPQKPKPAAKPAADSRLDDEADDEQSIADDAAGAMGTGGNVSVTVDRIMKPGTIVSGTVCFSDGVTASWSLDQMGRLVLNAGRPHYSPPPQDIPAFQTELKNVLSQKGF